MEGKKPALKVLMIDASNGYYKIVRYNVGDFFGPVDLGIHLAHKYNSLNIGTGLLAGSIFPGSNRMIFSGISPSWHGFFISSMGGAGLVFDNLGINLLAITGKTPVNSILYLNRIHGEEIEVELVPVKPTAIWKEGRGGVYSMMQHTYDLLGKRYVNDPRILTVGPASVYTDSGAIASAPISKGELTYVDTWAGRGGFGSKMVQQHGIISVIYGGTYLADDFRDRSVADSWFEDRYQKRVAAKDIEATTKYRFDPRFETGGTFGVNYATIKGDIMAFNYRTIYMTEEERLKIHNDFIVNHYLKQFNEETIAKKQQKTCGEPCGAVCKKMRGEFKKDYEPYQTMGPQCGIFDQRAAEKLNHQADMLGFDAISIGGVLSWLMDCMADNLLTPEELGISEKPVFSPDGFRVVEDSMHNADIGVALLNQIVIPNGAIDMKEGARKMARHMARSKGKEILDRFVYVAFARSGWIVPNQYWAPGVLSPMAIMGKYYMYYGRDFKPPRQLGRENAARLMKELIMDNLGMCRFHRVWAEDILPDVIGSLYGLKDEFLRSLMLTASRINSRNSSIFWESERNIDFVHIFLKKKKEIDGVNDPELDKWLEAFAKDRRNAALDFWYEVHKGIHESLLEFK
jgi:glyceraldehyde-3-phosphate dehydrogenase (ferredoxin)